MALRLKNVKKKIERIRISLNKILHNNDIIVHTIQTRKNKIFKITFLNVFILKLLTRRNLFFQNINFPDKIYIVKFSVGYIIKPQNVAKSLYKNLSSNN